MRHRFRVVGVGVAIGAVLALCFAGFLVPDGMSFRDRAFVWCAVMGGPVLGSLWGMAEYHSIIVLGWLGVILAPVHPIEPNWKTEIIAAIGLVLWFLSGFAAVMIAVWAG